MVKAQPYTQKALCKLLSLGTYYYHGAFTHNVKSMLNENLGGILGGTRCLNGR
jgi:hypothetical protein